MSQFWLLGAMPSEPSPRVLLQVFFYLFYYRPLLSASPVSGPGGMHIKETLLPFRLGIQTHMERERGDRQTDRTQFSKGHEQPVLILHSFLVLMAGIS